MVYRGITVIADPTLNEEEISAIIDEEIQSWTAKGKQLGTVELSLEGEAVLVKAIERSPIRRVRRITGYLSDLDNFNDAKKSECLNREIHTQ